MKISVKLALVALAAALSLASALSAASARSFSTSSQTLRVTWSNLEFTNSVGFGFVRCAFTLEGSLHSRTIAKIANSLIGAITRVAVLHPCTGGELIPRTETLPWHIQYEQFTGTLPTIRGLIWLLSRFRVDMVLPGICDGEYGSSTDALGQALSREAGGAITGWTPLSEDRATGIRTNSGICPGTAGFRNSSTSITALNSSSRITVTLI
jgi:hypothetical protein